MLLWLAVYYNFYLKGVSAIFYDAHNFKMESIIIIMFIHAEMHGHANALHNYNYIYKLGQGLGGG